MSARPRISLVTPTFNQSSTLRETIESVLGQDYENLEYWVLDAGSRDGTVEILMEYESDPRFHWLSEPDRGQSDAINKGLARCTGEIFNWINSDDYLESGSLQAIAASFEKEESIDIVSGKTAEFRDAPPQIFNTIGLSLRASGEETMTVGVFCQPSTFWRTNIIRELGGIDLELHYVMDWDLWVRYLARYGQDGVRQIDQLIAHYRHHPQAKTSAASEKFYQEAATIFRKLLVSLHAPEAFFQLEEGALIPMPEATYIFSTSFNRERYLGAYAERMVRVYRRKNPTVAKQWLKLAFEYKPWVTLWRIKMAIRLLFK